MEKPTEHLSNEDALLQEHEEFMRQVSESGVPTYLLQVYGEPTFKHKQDDNNQKTTQIGHNDPFAGTNI